jgi:hypothetical protein
MMQTAESRFSDHAAASHCWHSRIGSSLVQTEMCLIFMIVSYVIGEEPFQMSFVHGDDRDPGDLADSSRPRMVKKNSSCPLPHARTSLQAQVQITGESGMLWARHFKPFEFFDHTGSNPHGRLWSMVGPCSLAPHAETTGIRN